MGGSGGVDTFGGLSLAWIEQHTGGRIAVSSAPGYVSQLKRHIWPRIGDQPTSVIRIEHIEAVAWSLVKDLSLAPHTRRTLLAQFLMLASELLGLELPRIVRRRLYREAPDVPSPRWQRDQHRYTQAELECVLGLESLPVRNRRLVALCGLAGLRISEARGLKWRDILEDAPCARLLVERQRDKLKNLIGLPKNKRPRLVPIHPVLWTLLERDRYERCRSLDDFIEPRTYDGCSKAYDGVLEVAGIERRGRRFHDWRATFITLMREAKVPKDLRRVIVGHHHGGGREDVHDGYARDDWRHLCEATVLQLKIQPTNTAQLGLFSGR